jgi:hypothetical protein
MEKVRHQGNLCTDGSSIGLFHQQRDNSYKIERENALWSWVFIFWNATFCLLTVILPQKWWILLFMPHTSCPLLDIPWGCRWGWYQLIIRTVICVVMNILILSYLSLSFLYAPWQGGNGACSFISSSSLVNLSVFPSVAFDLLLSIQSHLCPSIVFWNLWCHVLVVGEQR